MSGDLNTTGPSGRHADSQGAALNSSGTGADSAARRAVTAGRLIGLVGSAAIVGQAAAWLCVGDPALRASLTWWCCGALLLCFVAILALRATSSVKGAEDAYLALWRLGLDGTKSRWWQAVVLPALLVPAYVALLVGLGASALQDGGEAEELAASGARIVAVPVEAVDPQGKVGKGRYDDYRAVYEVRLPVSGVGGPDVSDGRSVRLEVLSSEYLAQGDTLYVAYAPDDIALQPIADEERSQVEQELAGIALSFRVWVLVLVVWGAGTLWLAFWSARTSIGLRKTNPAGTVTSVPAVIHGYVQHATARDGRPGFVLRCNQSEDIPFELGAGSAKTAAAVLQGTQGHLMWGFGSVSGRRGRAQAALADFVAADGRRLHGAVQAVKLTELEAHGVSRSPLSPEGAAGAGTVDFSAAWPIAARSGTLYLLFLAYALLTPLYVLTHSGGWGVALAVASAVSVGAAFLYHWNKGE